MNGQQDFFDRSTKPCLVRSSTPCPVDSGMFCRCRYPHENHAGPHLCIDCRRRILPAPPTGPAAEPYHKEDGTPEALRAFLATEEGQTFWYAALSEARATSQDDRFSVLGFIHDFRREHKVRVNNSFAPYLADLLVLEDPDLEAVIERRKRKKEGMIQ